MDLKMLVKMYSRPKGYVKYFLIIVHSIKLTTGHNWVLKEQMQVRYIRQTQIGFLFTLLSCIIMFNCQLDWKDINLIIN